MHGGQRRNPTWTSRPLNVPGLHRQTLGRTLAAEIRNRILLREVTGGQRLESNRELARQAGVSLSTVREAIAELRADGVIEVRPGVGTFVTRRTRSARAIRSGRRQLSRRAASDLRWALEPFFAEAAAKRATPRQLLEVRHLLGERWLSRASGDPDRFVTGDLRFHDAVAEAANNSLGVATRRLATSIVRDYLRVHVRELVGHPDLDRLHAELADAVGARQPRRAWRLARRIADIEDPARAGGP